jgi:hypothetical protein
LKLYYQIGYQNCRQVNIQTNIVKSFFKSRIHLNYRTQNFIEFFQKFWLPAVFAWRIQQYFLFKCQELTFYLALPTESQNASFLQRKFDQKYKMLNIEMNCTILVQVSGVAKRDMMDKFHKRFTILFVQNFWCQNFKLKLQLCNFWHQNFV